jgi:hypothetical protein
MEIIWDKELFVHKKKAPEKIPGAITSTKLQSTIVNQVHLT